MEPKSLADATSDARDRQKKVRENEDVLGAKHPLWLPWALDLADSVDDLLASLAETRLALGAYVSAIRSGEAESEQMKALLPR